MNDKLLEELFGSKIRARVLKLFAHNPQLALSAVEAARRVKADRALCRRTMIRLARLDILKSYDVKNKKKKR
ncbi:MAG: hypothetical protein AAB642_03350 [Patescibacteria group bacterium]